MRCAHAPLSAGLLALLVALGACRTDPVATGRAALAPVVSLYVNDFNSAARASYRRVGFREVGRYASVLF